MKQRKDEIKHKLFTRNLKSMDIL